MIRVRSPALEDDVSLLRTQRSELKQSGAVRRWSTRHAQLRQAAVSHSRRCASRASAHATRAGPRATCVAVDRCGTSRSQRSATCASQAHSGFGDSVPASVPKLRPRCINRQPTPTKEPTKNGPEIVRFQARSVTRCHLSKPPPSASRPPHRACKYKVSRHLPVRHFHTAAVFRTATPMPRPLKMAPNRGESKPIVQFVVQ
jgi:hypothetical protein